MKINVNESLPAISLLKHSKIWQNYGETMVVRIFQPLIRIMIILGLRLRLRVEYIYFTFLHTVSQFTFHIQEMVI